MTSRRALLTACAALLAPHLRGAAAGLPSRYDFRFEWLEGAVGSASDARMDLGIVAADRKALRDRRILIHRRVAVRIDGPGPSVRLSVALSDETPGCTVSVDGVVLATVPRVIEPAHRLGAAVVHQVEIRIPADVAPGPHLSRLQWMAEPA